MQKLSGKEYLYTWELVQLLGSSSAVISKQLGKKNLAKATMNQNRNSKLATVLINLHFLSNPNRRVSEYFDTWMLYTLSASKMVPQPVLFRYLNQPIFLNCTVIAIQVHIKRETKLTMTWHDNDMTWHDNGLRTLQLGIKNGSVKINEADREELTSVYSDRKGYRQPYGLAPASAPESALPVLGPFTHASEWSVLNPMCLSTPLQLILPSPPCSPLLLGYLGTGEIIFGRWTSASLVDTSAGLLKPSRKFFKTYWVTSKNWKWVPIVFFTSLEVL